MKAKKIISSLILTFIFVIGTIANITPVKAAGVPSNVYVRVEGLKATIAEGTESGNTALDVVESLLKSKGITYHVKEDPAMGNYIDIINGLKAGDFKSPNFDGWQYFIKNSSGINLPGFGMASQPVQDGDTVVLYYGDMTTPYANSIIFTPNIVQENQGFKVKFSYNYTDYSNYPATKQVDMPISSAIVKINNLNYITDANGEITVEKGLPKGEYTYEISGYNMDKLPTVVMDRGSFKIDNVSTTSINYSDTKFNNLYQADNTKIVKDINVQLDAAKNFMQSNSSGDAWAAVSLNKLGIKTDLTFIKNSAVELKKSGVKEFSNTDLEKLIISLSASGYSPYSFMGQNLVSELFNRDINSFLINDAIYGLITFNYANISGSYNISKEKLVDFILSKKISYSNNGLNFTGWALSGNSINPDITGLAINSLAPFYSSTNVKVAIDTAVSSLSMMQNESGYLADSFGYSSESLSVVILGLTSVGVNPEGTLFTKLKGDLVSGLLSFKGTNGQFKHTLDGNNDSIATEEALRALIAIKEYKNTGKYNYYSSNIDAAKLPEFTLTDKELLDLGVLPQTGSPVDLSMLAVFGVLLIAAGIFTLRTKRLKEE